MTTLSKRAYVTVHLGIAVETYVASILLMKMLEIFTGHQFGIEFRMKSGASDRQQTYFIPIVGDKVI